MTHCSFPYSCCTYSKKDNESLMLCVLDHPAQYHQKNVTYSSEVWVPLPTLGGYITASGIITLDPFPRETGFTSSDTIAGLPIPQPNAHKHICTLIHDANWIWDNRVSWEGLRINSTKGEVTQRDEVGGTEQTQCSLNPHLLRRQKDKKGHTHHHTLTL